MPYRRLYSCLCLFVLFSSSLIYSKDYYVAKDGSDSNAGTLDKPFLTIQKAADIMVAGDRCLIRRGTYRETVVPANSGSDGSVIVYMPYNNERVVISGTEIIGGWSEESGSIYQAGMDWSLGKEYNQVFVDGTMIFQARFPNLVISNILDEKGYYVRDEHIYKLDGIDPLLRPAMVASGVRFSSHRVKVIGRSEEFVRPANYYDGGIYWGYHGAWRAQSAIINGSDDSSVAVLDSHWADSRSTAGYTKGGVIIGVKGLLDSPGEWYYNSETKKLSLWAPGSDNPAEHIVEAKKRLYAFKLKDKQHITIQGLYIFGASMTIEYCSDITVDNCRLKYITHYWHTANRSIGDGMYDVPGHRGVYVICHNFTFTNSSIEYSAGPGIRMSQDTTLEKHYMECKSARIENNLIRYIDYYGTYAAGINTCMQAPALVKNNTIYQVGRSCININCGGGYYSGHNMQFFNNVLGDAMMIATDGGNFYLYGVSGQGSEFAYNILYNNHNHQGALLYLDQGGWFWIIHHNVLWIKDGVNYRNIGPTSYRNMIYNNTIIEAGWGWPEGDVRNDRQDYNNTLFCNGNPDSCGLKDYKNFDFSLKETSLAIDKGSPICSTQVRDGQIKESKFYDNPYTMPADQYTGAAPDLGAFEYGLEPWKAGHDWGEPDWQYPLADGVGAIRVAAAGIGLTASLAVRPNQIVIRGAQWTCRIYDAGGRLVKTAEHFAGHQTASRISTEDLPAGMYIAKLTTKTMSKMVSFIKTR